MGLLAFLDEETKKSLNDPTNFLGNILILRLIFLPRRHLANHFNNFPEQIHADLHTPFLKKAEDASSFVIAHYSGQVGIPLMSFS